MPCRASYSEPAREPKLRAGGFMKLKVVAGAVAVLAVIAAPQCGSRAVAESPPGGAIPTIVATNIVDLTTHRTAAIQIRLPGLAGLSVGRPYKVKATIQSDGPGAGVVVFAPPTLGGGKTWSKVAEVDSWRMHRENPKDKSNPTSQTKPYFSLAPGTYRLVVYAAKHAHVELVFPRLSGHISLQLEHKEKDTYADAVDGLPRVQGNSIGFARTTLKVNKAMWYVQTLFQTAARYTEATTECLSDPPDTDRIQTLLEAQPGCPYELKNHRDEFDMIANYEPSQCATCDESKPPFSGVWEAGQISTDHVVTASLRFQMSGAISAYLFTTMLFDVSDVISP